MKVILMGGLGNQLFQMSECLRLRDEGENVIVDISVLSNFWYQKKVLKHTVCDLYVNQFNMFNIFKKNNSYWTLFLIVVSKFLKKLSGKKIILISDSDGVGLLNYSMMYYQDMNIARKYSSEIFDFSKPFSEKNRCLSDEIKKKKSIAVHIRRGDYLFDQNSKFAVCDLGYYQRCLARCNGHDVYVFSNDIEWCKSTGIFPGNTVYVSHNVAKECIFDVALMAVASELIIANSTFSTWAGLFSLGKIYAPSEYFKGCENMLILPHWNVEELSSD